MAYLIFTANGEEYDRRELNGGVTIGRAPDCDINIHDIILSRHHCRIEKTDHGWFVTDLHSKNGTFVHGRRVERHALLDGSELQVGRTHLTFKTGAFVPSAAPSRRRAVHRPADPSEALAGTVTGMVLCEPGEVEHHQGMPVPQPRPRDPSSFQNEDVYGMINEIASSSWDSIMAHNSQPIRMQRAMAVPAVTKAHRGAIRPKARVAFSLQAEHRESVDLEQPVPPGARRASSRRRRWIVAGAIILIALACWAAMILNGYRVGVSDLPVNMTTQAAHHHLPLSLTFLAGP